MTQHLCISALFISLTLSVAHSSEAVPTGNGKKIYADYHGVRYTRAHDGKLGRWSYYANTEKSTTGVKNICYNADVFNEEGFREIAAVDYPLVGVHSSLDPEYIEYQILTAKAAGIDGFFIEWGYFPHERLELLLAMQREARKYNFEIGVNWCNQKLHYDCITHLHPKINTRKQKTKDLAQCYQWLVDNVLYNTSTAPTVGGVPVLYLVNGGGGTNQEYRTATATVQLPNGQPHPAVLRRWAEWGSLKDNTYQPMRYTLDNEIWMQDGTIPTPWLPARVRQRNEQYAQWDNYATQEDMVESLKPFRDSIWKSTHPSLTLKSGFAMPGMDNRGCAGWGQSHFFYMPRNEGNTYHQMWQFNLNNKELLDMVIIASWNNYTEGHEIEPTVMRGYRELETTRQAAEVFKEVTIDSEGMELPLQLLRLRKQLRMYKLNTPTWDAELDSAAALISSFKFDEATTLLAALRRKGNNETSNIKTKRITLHGSDVCVAKRKRNPYAITGLSIQLPKEVKRTIMNGNYFAELTFQYKDHATDVFKITSFTNRTPTNLFSIVAEIKKNNSGTWRKATIRLAPENIAIVAKKPFLMFKGKGEVKDVKLDITVWENKDK